MKAYLGQRPADDAIGDCRVFVLEDGHSRPLPLITRHSNQFEWAYAGSGPATTALSILTDFLGCEPPRPLYQRFKFTFIVSAAREGFTFTTEQIDAWLAQQPDDPRRSGLSFRTGFQAWITEPARARSPEVDYGCWWTLDAHSWYPHWRVSYIVDTGEVYAVALEGPRPDRFTVLGRITGGREAMESAMRGWAEGHMQLANLAGRFE